MELYVEVFLTAVISILFAFLLGKFAPVGGDGSGRSPAEAADLKADPVTARDRKVKVLAEDMSERAEVGQGSAASACRAVDDDHRSESVLILERIETGDVREEVGQILEEEEDGMERAEEVRAGKVDVEKEKGGDGRGSEVNEPILDETSVKEITEKMEIDRIYDDLVKEEEGFARDLRLEEPSVGIERIDAGMVKEEERLMKGELSREKVVSLPKDEVSAEEVGQLPAEEISVERVASLPEAVVGEKQEKEDSEEKGGSLLQGEDEWEGIERSEMDKMFGRATAFASSESGGAALSRLGSDEQMQLYGLHKVATEGPCYEPQPMALKVSARAKWYLMIHLVPD